MRRSLAIGAMVAAVGLCGCASTRVDMPSFTSGTESNLSRNNFRVLDTNVRGVSYGFALFGLIPIVAPTVSDAMRDLHQHTHAAGRAVALVDIAKDSSTTYLILFSVPKVTVSADVIEFIDEPTVAKAGQASPPPR